MEKEKNKILLVEDDTNFGQVLKNYLELNDFVVELARDGILGLAAFRRERFDICLLDVMLPGIDGFSVSKQIRQQRNQNKVQGATDVRNLINLEHKRDRKARELQGNSGHPTQ